MHHEYVQRGSLHSAAGPASPEVEEQRRACCCSVREHGPDALVAKGSMIGSEGLGGGRKGIVGAEDVPRQLQRLRAPRRGVL